MASIWPLRAGARSVSSSLTREHWLMATYTDGRELSDNQFKELTRLQRKQPRHLTAGEAPTMTWTGKELQTY